MDITYKYKIRFNLINGTSMTSDDSYDTEEEARDTIIGLFNSFSNDCNTSYIIMDNLFINLSQVNFIQIIKY